MNFLPSLDIITGCTRLVKPSQLFDPAVRDLAAMLEPLTHLPQVGTFKRAAWYFEEGVV